MGDTQNRDVTVVDLVQLGVLGFWLGPDLDNARIGDGTNLLPLGFGAGACDRPLFEHGRKSTLWTWVVKVEIAETSDAHAHLLPSAVHGVPVIDAKSCGFKAARAPRALHTTVKMAVATAFFAQPARGVPLPRRLWLTDPAAFSTHPDLRESSGLGQSKFTSR